LPFFDNRQLLLVLEDNDVRIEAHLQSSVLVAFLTHLDLPVLLVT
jgi:hypothetical protein